MFNYESYLDIKLDDFRKNSICKILNSYERLAPETIAMTKILRTLDICPAYDWIGHRNEWFYPTAIDVEMQEEFVCQSADWD